MPAGQLVVRRGLRPVALFRLTLFALGITWWSFSAAHSQPGQSASSSDVGQAARAPDQQKPTEAPALEREIVVYGTRGDALESFVASAARPSRVNQLARWNTPICIKVEGLSEKRARQVAGDIVSIARALGVYVDLGRCLSNVHIVFSRDATAFTQKLLNEEPLLFRPGKRHGQVTGEEKASLLAPRPVRWFYVTEQMVQGGFASRLAVPEREDKYLSYLIVDARKTSGVRWKHLASYLAFVALASPDMNAEFRADTILSLFRDEGRQSSGGTGLTALDWAFLRAYHSYPEQVPGHFQRSDILYKVKAAVSAE